MKSPGNHFKEHLIRARHDRDAAVVSALRLVALLVEYGNNGVFPLLGGFSLVPDGPFLLYSEFQQFHGKAVRCHCFRV